MSKRGKKLLTWFTIFCIILTQAVLSSAAFAETTQVKRLYGSDRYKTAVAISQSGWSEGSTYAVIARGDDFADALCAGPLAKKFGAPILLTETGNLNIDTLNELKRLKVKNVFIAGGAGAVSQKVEDAIKAEGISVERLWGNDRYETSVKIAEKVGTSSNMVLATGDNFPDALSISSIAAKSGMPILLTGKDSLPNAVSNYIAGKQINKTYIIGGTGVISESVKNLVPNPVRLGGSNRYETNTIVMNEFAAQLSFTKLYAAVGDGPNGDEFADALSGAVLAAQTSSPVILAYKSLAEISANFIKSKITLSTEVTALGGEAVVPSAIVNSILALKDNTVAANYNKAGTYGPEKDPVTIKGTVVISAPDVTLQNTIIDGDLILAESIGDGTVNLKNITVKGTTTINGGGPNSVIMYNFNGKTVVVNVPDGSLVRLVAQGSTSIDNISMESDGILDESGVTGDGFTDVTIPEGVEVTLIGKFDKVDVQAKGATVNVESGTIGTLNIGQAASNSTINLSTNATVTLINVYAPSSITGGGTILYAYIGSNGVNMAQTPTQGVTRAAGVTEGQIGGAPITRVPIGNPPVPPKTPPTTPGGGGGGGGGTPAITINSIAVTYNDGSDKSVLADASNTIDLSTKGDSIQVKSVTVDTDEPGTIVLESLTNANGIVLKLPDELKQPKPLPTVTIEELLGDYLTGDNGVNIKTLRAIFGNRVTIDFTVTGDNEATEETTIVMLLGGPTENEYFTVTEVGNNTIKATIKSGKATTSLDSVSVYGILNTIGQIPYEVTLIDRTTSPAITTTIEVGSRGSQANQEIKDLLTGGNWDSWNLGELADYLNDNKTLKFRKTSGGTQYTMIISR